MAVLRRAASEVLLSLVHHLDTLGVYGASACRVEPSEGEPEDLVGEGGALADRFESVGHRPLLAVLADPAVARVLLADGPLELEALRSGGEGQLIVRWNGDKTSEERLPLPSGVRASGPLFRPDRTSEVRQASDAQGVALYGIVDRDSTTRWYSRGFHGDGVDAQRLLVHVPPLGPSDMGAASFRESHQVRYNYVAGAMAGAIASVELVAAMAEAGLLAFYGAGGVPLEHVDAAMQTLSERLGDRHAWGANLLNNPAEPAVEEQTVDIYLRHGVRRISASAYMTLSEAVVRYRLTGIHLGPDGKVEVPNKVFAKVSRREVATPFMQPAPEAMLASLVERGVLSEEQAGWARQVPIASDVTAEADSGGHTDHRSLPVLLPEMIRLRDALATSHNYDRAHVPRVGAAGGLGTPASIWAAFAMGADYVLTGSINQATVEAGTSAQVKAMLSVAESHDVASGPAPDMFEIGAKVQVLSRGSMYAQRAQRLHDLYTRYPSMDDLPEKERARVEKQLFKRSLDEVWEGTRAYWAERDPAQVERADREPRHKMALTFRWYLGMTSRWARMGEDDRKRDFQIWCGPSMGGFNGWAKGGPLEAPERRTVVALADALMDEAAMHARASVVRAHGVPVPSWMSS